MHFVVPAVCFAVVVEGSKFVSDFVPVAVALPVVAMVGAIGAASFVVVGVANSVVVGAASFVWVGFANLCGCCQCVVGCQVLLWLPVLLSWGWFLLHLLLLTSLFFHHLD